jgi:two-component system, NtrC family, response regulator HydG
MTGTNEATPLKILVVDNEIELMNVMVELLSTESWNVRGCSSGRDALKLLRDEKFDLMITDLMMPEMDGPSLIKAAHLIDLQLRVIVMTGSGAVQTTEQAATIGASDFILKPFHLKTLLPVITRVLNAPPLQNREDNKESGSGRLRVAETLRSELARLN